MDASDRCLCACMHIKTGTIVIAVLYILSGVANLGKILNSADSSKGAPLTVGDGLYALVIVVFFIIPAGCAIGGARSNKPKMLIPLIVLQGIMIVLFALGLVAVLLHQIKPDLTQLENETIGEVRRSLIILAVLAALFLMKFVFFEYTVWNCYKHIKGLLSSHESSVSYNCKV